MGGDQLVPALVGREVDEETGDAIRETRDVLYRKLIDEVEAARKAGVESICVITGGYSEAELRDAGAAAVFESVVDLREHLDETPLGSQA